MDLKASKSPGDPHVEQLDDAAMAAALPASTANHHAKLSDFWRHRRILGFCLIVYLLPINFGYEMGTLGKLFAVIPFARRFGYQVDGIWVVSAQDQQILSAPGTAGLFIAAPVAGWLGDLIGRRSTILVASIICIGGVIFQFFSNTILMLFGGKLLATFGFGLAHSLAPVFVAELAPVELRGFCLALNNTMILIGSWLCSVTVLGCEHYDNDLAWRIPLATQLLPPGLTLIGLFILPESPTWLIMKGLEQKALRALQRYNGPGFDSASALAVAKVAISQEKAVQQEQAGARWVDCFRGANGRRTTIAVTAYTSQQLVGCTFITGYLTYYFRLAGVQDPLAVGQASFAIQVAGNIASWPLVDRVGRRPLMNIGTYIMTGLLVVIGGISVIDSKTSLSGVVALMCIWAFVYSGTLGAIAYTVTGETPSHFLVQLRQKTYSISMMVSVALGCAITQATPYLINSDQANLGGKICFVFFGLSLPMCGWLYFYMPELKGRNDAEIQEMFNEGLPARKFKSHVCAVSADTHDELKSREQSRVGNA